MSAAFPLLGADWSATAKRSTQPLGPLAAVSIIVGLPLLWPIGWVFEALQSPCALALKPLIASTRAYRHRRIQGTLHE